ncbi:hypothetical protein H310_03133 [Aphanomyces invadans]|uniref:Peptidase C1A papain C-terminal domain-containing protein n=1 Tax=Aphanomyces invadans TaxID=157072 RepID=A0A024UL74_9STRA|nr:hypothetical protein H310_03133 [Aphanomyces invadans]ETW07054.1 hypothetical protein H310_03133 [Aphanomyces invadans]RHY23555.1 hypothetical protein DYB32_009142 [Aphanomyces invadans]|eukprot:XP_008865129.1 hypothetical protein H310_03133 [Aphanomyces invadans]
MRAVFALSGVAATAAAVQQSVMSMSADERMSLEQDLAEWKAEFGEVARQNGLLPAPSSIMSEEDKATNELQRLLDTKLSAEEAALANPDASFNWRNQFALMSNAEFKAYVAVSFRRGSLLRGEIVETSSDEEAVSVQATKDWTSSGCVSPVQNQGSCGSCWAFSAVGVSESAHCIKTGRLLKLSEQQVASCSTNGGSQGCNGGFPWAAIDYASRGLCLASAYPYTSGSSGQTGACKTSCAKQTLSIGTSARVSGDSGVASALNRQPLSVTVEAGNSVWKNYRGGVVSSCPGAQSDHAVIAVGYDGTSFKVKNSWGTGWGESGYIRLKRTTSGQGTCNVVGAASYPRI